MCVRALPMLVCFSLCVSRPAWCLTAKQLLHTVWRGLVGEPCSVSLGPRDAHMLSSLTACAPCLPQVLALARACKAKQAPTSECT